MKDRMQESARIILIVEDDPAVGKVLSVLLRQSGFETLHVTSAEDALLTFEKQPVDLVLSDVRLPSMDGIALLKELTRRAADIPVVLLTAHGSVSLAVEAMKLGAADFLLKPFDRDEIVFVVSKAMAQARAVEARVPRLELGGKAMVGQSAQMREVYRIVEKVASNTSTVLVIGETGTGKELVARALHESGPRKDHPFVRVHCAALPDSLLETELFGHEKGAFTGATARKPGRVEIAHRGTLFLDEIGDISPQVQVKLLRVLQEREFERVGGTQTIKVDVRFVAATHRNLEEMVSTRQFREDLFYRLSVVPLRVPALRDRSQDIDALAEHFAREISRANGRPRMSLDAGALARLRAHAWPGNVRELQNVIERLVVLGEGEVIGAGDVARELGAPAENAGARNEKTGGQSLPTMQSLREDAEKAALVSALERAGNNRTLAARLLNVSRRTLYNKLRLHGLLD